MFGKILLLILFLLCLRTAQGQSFFFTTLGTNDGLPTSIINSIAQDKQQFIWVGTANGLARFDGYHFKNFKKEENIHSLPANEISALLAVDDDVWVGTWRGLCKLNTTTFDITRIELSGNNTVRCLYKDSKDFIWVGTANGLIRIDPKTLKQRHFTRENSALSHNTIRSLFEDKRGNLWVGTYDKLNRLEAGGDHFINFDLKGTYKPELKNNLICDIKPVEKSDSLIWVGTETGLSLFNTYTHRYVSYNSRNTNFSNEVIKNIYVGRNGLLWLGTDFGLNVFDTQKKSNISFFHNPQINYSIANNVIWQILEDSGGVIWIVTSNGLSRTNKYNHFFTFREVSHRIGEQNIGNQVKALLVAKSGTLWIATIHGVITIDPVTQRQTFFDSETGVHKNLLLNNVFALEEDDFGRIWIGTAGGINVWEPKSEIMHAVTAAPENGLTSNYIAKFIKAKDGSFWVSAWEGGLFKIVKGFSDLKDLRFEFMGDFGSEKIAYARNALWSISNNELYRVDINSYITKKVSSFNDATEGRDVYNIYASDQGVIWAGTSNGLIEYNTLNDSVSLHKIITGGDVTLNNIISDQHGNIWAAAHRFILRFSPTDNQTVIYPLDKELPLKTFYTNCSAVSKTGDLLFGGDNGYLIFSPLIRPNNFQPNVLITNLQVNNTPVYPLQKVNEKILLDQDIALTSELSLDYSHRSVTFEFSSLHFWQPDINVYAYKLEGFDEDWTFVSGSKNFAVYSNLPAKTYKFRVRGSNNYAVWSSNEASLNLTVAPPLFLSTPFLISYAVVFILIAAGTLRIYTIRLKLKNDVRIAVLEKEHAEEIVSTKQNFFTSISHELRTPISLIVPPIQEVLKRGHLQYEDRSLLSIAEKNSKRLLRLINQILDYRKLEYENQSLKISWFDIIPYCYELYSLFTDKATRNEIDFQFVSRVNQCSIWADKEKVEIIIFNLLSNAFKFTPRKGKILFIIDEIKSEAFPDGAISLSVTDNGIGISESDQQKIFDQFYQTEESKKLADGYGIGLTLVAEFTKMHKGEISLTSNKESGSNFTIILPQGSSHLPVDQSHEGKEVDLLAVKQDLADGHYQYNLNSEKPVVLLVEDNIDMQDFITISLKHKYHFIVCTTGAEGLQKAQNVIPEIILSDIMMPVMDGLELCRRIKQDNKTSHIPIIILTAKSLTSQKVEGIRSGADTYITKPFEIELLEAHIDHLLERKLELALYFKHELLTQPVSESGKENEDDRFLKKVMNTIEANLSNPEFSVELLSDEMGMSTTQLYRKLKTLTHISGNEIIKKYRIKKASLLLKNKEGNISEIMYEVGFSNLSYFSKCFKTEYGITPKEYQQRESKSSFDIDAR